ncbi:MAG: EexN family lipoprotein [Syntrophobacterales bacterium]|jgi:PBP1b-binding outer membrane lipoprotein LpoB|nr:EexN family lipoprotein [Syntrophobacterales bacterium]
MKKLLLLVAIAMLFPACGSKTVEYYEQHPEEMKAKIEQCKRLSSAEKMIDRECSAAIDAYSATNLKRQFDFGPPRRPLDGPGKGPGIQQY